MQTRKVHSAAKIMIHDHGAVKKIILSTTQALKQVVGKTFGPAGGVTLLDEPTSDDFPSKVTKDGLNVLLQCGFQNPAQHAVFSIVKDGAWRTAREVGDGTTTTTILTHGFTEAIFDNLQKHKMPSPQAAARRLIQAAEEELHPFIAQQAVKPKIEKDRDVIYKTALTSVNGDEALAEAVVQCFEKGGDYGNVNVWQEHCNETGYSVEPIFGYALDVGYEESCRRPYPAFLDSVDSATINLSGAKVLCFNGNVFNLADQFKALFEQIRVLPLEERKLIFCAHTFTDDVLSLFANGWGYWKKAMKGVEIPKNVLPVQVLPVRIPPTMQAAGIQHQLEDIAAMVAGKLYDPSDKDIVWEELSDLCRVRCERARTIIMPDADDFSDLAKRRMAERMNAINEQLKQSTGELDRILIEERRAKVSQSLIRLTVKSPSRADLKERSDHAEDAVCAVRSALRNGVVFGGGWTWYRLLHRVSKLKDEFVRDVFTQAITEVVDALIRNYGEVPEEEISKVIAKNVTAISEDKSKTFDLFTSSIVGGKKLGVYDSLSSISVSLRNALTVASQLASCKAIIAFPRDGDLENAMAERISNLDMVVNHAANSIDSMGVG